MQGMAACIERPFLQADQSLEVSSVRCSQVKTTVKLQLPNEPLVLAKQRKTAVLRNQSID